MTVMKAVLPNNQERTARLDGISGNIVTIDNTHNNIHRGMHYRAFAPVNDLTAGDTLRVALDLPSNTDKLAHSTYRIYSTGEVKFTLYEGVTSFTGGTEIVPACSRRHNPQTSALQVHYGYAGHTPITRNGGTPLYLPAYLGKTGSIFRDQIGGTTRNDDEVIFDYDTLYMFELKSLENTQIQNVYIELLWYEYPPYELSYLL
jgi:hypothetical protein